MTNLEQLLERAIDTDGAFAAAISDHKTGSCIGARSSRLGFDAGAAGALDGDVVRAKLAALGSLGLGSEIEDMLFTLGEQYHLIRPLAGTTLFLTLVLRRDQANLALARRGLKGLETELLAAGRQLETAAIADAKRPTATPAATRLGPRKLNDEELRRAS